MKILCYSDWHLRDRGSFYPYHQIGDSGYSKELENILRAGEFVANQIRDHRPDVVANLGDTYHSPNSLSAEILKASDEVFGLLENACKEAGSRHLIILGNHDIKNENLGIHCTDFLRKYCDSLVTETIHEMSLSLIPASKDIESVAKDLKIAESKGNVILTHQDFNGASYESGYKSESILSPHLSVPVLSGDLHCKQDVGSVHYPGSLVQNRFNRKNLDLVGGTLVFDTDSGDVERTPNTYSRHYVLVNSIEEALSFDQESVLLKVVTSEPEEEVRKALAGYEYWYVPVFESHARQENDPEVDTSADLFDLFRDYVESREDSEDPDLILSLAKEVFNES